MSHEISEIDASRVIRYRGRIDDVRALDPEKADELQSRTDEEILIFLNKVAAFAAELTSDEQKKDE